MCLVEGHLVVDNLHVEAQREIDTGLLVDQLVEGVLHRLHIESLEVFEQLGICEPVLNKPCNQVFLVDKLVEVLVVLGPQPPQALDHLLNLHRYYFVTFLLKNSKSSIIYQSK